MKKVRERLPMLLGVLIMVSMLVLPITHNTPAEATDITVTAAPSYIEFSSTPVDWGLNNLTGSGLIDENTTYYANPLGDTTTPSATVVDGECYFDWSNNSSVNISITVNCGSFAGGDADMSNSNSGSNGATTYGAYAWYSGMTYASAVIVQSSGSDPLYNTTCNEKSIFSEHDACEYGDYR